MKDFLRATVPKATVPGFQASLILALAVTAGPGFLEAREPWIDAPFSADARAVAEAAKKVPVPAGANVVVLYRDTSYRFDTEGRITYHQRLLYRLLTPKAVEGWAEVEVDYAPWHQRRPRLRARVISAGGRESWLDETAVVESALPGESADVVTDRRMVKAKLPGLGIGAVVEEEVEVTDAEPFFPAGTAGVYPLQMFAPVHRGRFVLAAPTTLPLRYGVRLMPELKPRQRLDDGYVELTFHYGGVPAAEPIASGLSSHRPRLPQISFSTGESWQSVAASYSRIVDAKIESADLGEFAGRLGTREPATDPTEKIARILAELHREVRYSGLELGASSLIPASPEVTLERGFGDCKDKATLLVALLRREGLPAHVVLLNAGFGRDVENQLPGIGRFDHAIVFVGGSDRSAPPIWIDPTERSARVGELPATDQNRWALIASPETTKLLRTPSANSIDNLTMEQRDVFLAEHGPGRIVEKSVYHGEQERQQRRLVDSGDDEGRREGYRDYVVSTYLAEELGEVEETDPDDFSRPFTLSLEALGSNRAVTDLSEAVVAIRQEGLVASLPMAIQRGNAPRELAFVIDRPFVTEWHYRIEPPLGFTPRDLPADEERRFGPARYSRRVSREEDVIKVDLRFDSGPRHLSAADFTQMRQGIQAFLDEEPLLVWFDHVGAQALNEGHSREAIEHFRGLAEERPDMAIHRIRLAQALLRLGLAGEAVRQAREATELEPDSALAWWCLGFALEHDELGRRFGLGFDRASALAALEKAVELAADDPLPRTELAILLEYNDEGQRYVTGADLDRAAAHYRILRDELGARNLEVNLVSALFWAQRWEELYAATIEMHETPVSPYLHLVALAILRGPEAAIREAANLSSTLEEQLSLLNSAAQHLVIARRYKSAAALLRRAARDIGNPAPLLERAEVLARAERYEELAVETGSATELARSLFLVLGRRDYSRAALSRLFHPQYLEDRADEESALEESFNRLRQEQFKSAGELPVEAVLDLALSILETAVDGAPRLGFRVRLLNRMNESKVAFHIYVTSYEDRLVIAAIDKEFGQMAKEIRRRLDLGDLRGAHQWLDWARDAIRETRTDDPYGFEPFARFWTRGTGAFREKMRLGAALLAARSTVAAEFVPVLEEALDQATAEHRRTIETGLFLAYGRLDDTARLGELCTRLLEREPKSALAFLGRARQLLAEDRLNELEALSEQRLDALPKNLEATRFLVRAATRRRAPDKAIAYYEAIRDSGKLRSRDYNLWSWLLLFEDPISEQSLTLAQRGATISKFRDQAMLHTLATVYAQLGRPAEARQVLLQSLSLREDPSPTADDWYVVGRMAEEYGYTELARDFYSRVPQVEREDEPYTSSELVARRLDLMSKGPKKGRPPSVRPPRG